MNRAKTPGIERQWELTPKWLYVCPLISLKVNLKELGEKNVIRYCLDWYQNSLEHKNSIFLKFYCITYIFTFSFIFLLDYFYDDTFPWYFDP